MACNLGKTTSIVFTFRFKEGHAPTNLQTRLSEICDVIIDN